jgi:allantoin racemase
MRILLINPNTTASMTEKMFIAGRSVIAAGTVLDSATAAFGPESIEGYYDEVFSVPPMLDAIRAAGAVDGVVVGCFDDTGVDAARCLIDAPVIGICQAAMQAASILSGSFSVVTTLRRSVPALEGLARKYGFADQCRSVRAAEIPVLSLEEPGSEARARIGAEIEIALHQDTAEAIVLGCGGMADLANELSQEFGVPVIEGVTAAVKCVEGLAAIGLMTSSVGGYAKPRAKSYLGEFQRFAPKN